MPWQKDDLVWVDDEPVDPEKEGWRKWIPLPQEALERVKVYPYAVFYSLERAGIGLISIKGDLATGKILAQHELREIPYYQSLAPLLEFDEALEAVAQKETFITEEVPHTEIIERKDYDAILKAQGINPTNEPWEGPGVYDVRDAPPTRGWNSAEEYERDVLKEEADHLIEYIFSGGLMRSDLSGDEWKDAYSQVVKEAWEEMSGGDL